MSGIVASGDILGEITIQGKTYKMVDLNKVQSLGYPVDKLPYAKKILLENVLRTMLVHDMPIETELLASITSKNIVGAEALVEINFSPSRVILQDFTGVPAIVDLASMRDAIKSYSDPKSINPQVPVDLVVDHSIIIQHHGSIKALELNEEEDFARNQQRYSLLKWAQSAFKNLKVVPPNAGIVHQINLECLARMVFATDEYIYPDSVVGTDSHTTMINGLGILGWGVGGIEAEAAMLGQPISMVIPDVVGVRFENCLSEGVTATDLVLYVVEKLREMGVVGKFVEFFGPGLSSLTVADRATLANMAPEYGATCGIFPFDKETVKYLDLTNRSLESIELVEYYMQNQGLDYTNRDPNLDIEYDAILNINLNDIKPAVAGPKRPQDRVEIENLPKVFESCMDEYLASRKINSKNSYAELVLGESNFSITHGDIVIAAITSCTNTSNPQVMIGAALLAKKAIDLGLYLKPWVKASFAPGSKVVTEYLEKAGLKRYLDEIGFNLVGYGCTTCIGNSGPLPEPIRHSIVHENLACASVLSGNRNFEGRIHPDVRMSFLASPPLVIAYAIAGTVNIDIVNSPLGHNIDGDPVYLGDIWPSNKEISDLINNVINKEMFAKEYSNIFDGDAHWQKIKSVSSDCYDWDLESTYIKQVPFFDNFQLKMPKRDFSIDKARVLLFLGDSVTTDHISPAGQIGMDVPAGEYLMANSVSKNSFNSYGARRGNHEVMMRGTFANVRIQNKLVPGVEGGVTKSFVDNSITSVFEASRQYKENNIPTIILAGAEYGTGSSRDWAAKGPHLLGVSAVIAESYERIHRSNLIGMGILPLEFIKGESVATHDLSGDEEFSIMVDDNTIYPGQLLKVEFSSDRHSGYFSVKLRIDTAKELSYVEHGGILSYMLRKLA